MQVIDFMLKLVMWAFMCLLIGFLLSVNTKIICAINYYNVKTELEIKRLQYEIKLMEEQGVPVDVE